MGVVRQVRNNYLKNDISKTSLIVRTEKCVWASCTELPMQHSMAFWFGMLVHLSGGFFNVGHC